MLMMMLMKALCGRDLFVAVAACCGAVVLWCSETALGFGGNLLPDAVLLKITYIHTYLYIHSLRATVCTWSPSPPLSFRSKWRGGIDE